MSSVEAMSLAKAAFSDIAAAMRENEVSCSFQERRGTPMP